MTTESWASHNQISRRALIVEGFLLVCPYASESRCQWDGDCCQRKSPWSFDEGSRDPYHPWLRVQNRLVDDQSNSRTGFKYVRLSSRTCWGVLRHVWHSHDDKPSRAGHFKHSTTVVIPKPGKPSYRETKAYRPIALMNTVDKILDSIIARRLQYYAEHYHLLLRNHTRG